MTTLAKKLGMTEHHSLLLRKAREAGLNSVPEMIGLAIARGCQHYRGGPELVPAAPLSREAFSDEELAIALLSPCLPYSSRAVRVGAQMLVDIPNSDLRLLAFGRPATIDLILTKMMRGPDPDDMEDVCFYLEREPAIGVDELQIAFAAAVGPDIPEIWQLFAAAKPVVLAIAQESDSRL